MIKRLASVAAAALLAGAVTFVGSGSSQAMAGTSWESKVSGLPGHSAGTSWE